MNQPPKDPSTPSSPSTFPHSIIALIAGILGLIGLGCITGIPAIMALSEMKSSAPKRVGKGFAWTGLIMGYLATFFSITGIAVYFMIARSEMNEVSEEAEKPAIEVQTD